MRDHDVIVVGGGLAGSSFALELAREGARVALIERTVSPTLKVCGDFLSAEAQELLAHLGLDVAGMGATQIKMFRLVAGQMRASAELPFAGAGLSRFKLDEALLHKAAAAGVEVIRGAAASELKPEESGVSVRAGDTVFRARWAALATGKHNMRGWPRTTGAMTAYKLQLAPSRSALQDLAGVVQIASYRGGYIGACNVEDGQTTICWLADRHLMRSLGPDWRAHLDKFSRHCSAVGDLLAGAHLIGARPAAVSGIPYGFKRRQVIAPNVFPLGDQLCVIPSYTGDGTSLALSSGVAAARTIVQGGTAAEFQTAFLHSVRAQFFYARAVDASFKSRTTRRLAVRTVGMAPSVARLFARLTRARGVSELTAPAALGAAKAPAQ